MYQFHQNILLRPHFPNYCINFCFIKMVERVVKCYLAALHLCPGSNTVAKISQQIVLAILATKKELKKLSEMCRKHRKHSKNNKFNKDCKLQQNFATNFCRNSSKNMFNRNCLQKSRKIAKVTRNFIAPKKHPDNHRKYIRV